MSISKVRFKYFFRPQTYYIYIYLYIYIYMDTTVDHFTPLALRVRGKNDSHYKTSKPIPCIFFVYAYVKYKKQNIGRKKRRRQNNNIPINLSQRNNILHILQVYHLTLNFIIHNNYYINTIVIYIYTYIYFYIYYVPF